MQASARSWSAAISSRVPPVQAATWCRRSSAELGLQARIQVRAPPPELPQVEERAVGREQRLDLLDRRAAVDRRRDAGGAGLGRAGLEIEERGTRHFSYRKRSPTIVQPWRTTRSRTVRGSTPWSRPCAPAPGWRSKQHIGVVGDVFGAPDWLRGPGDDGAVVDADGTSLVVCGEAILPAFLERDPFGAGIAAVLTNVNDVAAMGAVPLAVVDTLVGDEATCRTALEGMRHASALYDVPVVGGHLTIDPVRQGAVGLRPRALPRPSRCRPPRSARDSASACSGASRARCGRTSRSSPPSTSAATGWPATFACWPAGRGAVRAPQPRT